MSNHNDQASKSAKPAPSAAAAKTVSESPPPKTWNDIKVGSLVIAHESDESGWWEAIVTEIKGEQLTVRWRDFPRQRPIVVSRKDVAFFPTS